jgi:hypothetical protein
MFNIFKRAAPAPQHAAPQPSKPAPSARAAPPAPATQLPDPGPMLEVQEGNEQTDWALWEDSVLVMDSQMQGLTPSARIYERVKERPSEYQDLDPFGSIGKNSP